MCGKELGGGLGKAAPREHICVATEDLFRVANLLGTFRWTVGVFFFALFSLKKILGVLSFGVA